MTYTRKIYGYQCDIYGHLNNGNYLPIYEEARAETLEQIDFPIDELLNQGIEIYVTRIEIDYIKGVKLGEIITVETVTSELTRIKGIWNQTIKNGKGEICNKAVVKGVFTKNGKPCRIPRVMYESMKSRIDN